MGHLENYIGLDGRTFFVSTCYTFDCGYETMIFEVFNGEVDYMDLYVEHYNYIEEAKNKHMEICKNIAKYIK